MTCTSLLVSYRFKFTLTVFVIRAGSSFSLPSPSTAHTPFTALSLYTPSIIRQWMHRSPSCMRCRDSCLLAARSNTHRFQISLSMCTFSTPPFTVSFHCFTYQPPAFYIHYCHPAAGSDTLRFVCVCVSLHCFHLPLSSSSTGSCLSRLISEWMNTQVSVQQGLSCRRSVCLCALEGTSVWVCGYTLVWIWLQFQCESLIL